MDLPADFRDALIEAKKMQDQGRLLDAERILRNLAEKDSHRHLPLEALADLYLKQRRFEECLNILRALIEIEPGNVRYSTKLANLLESLGDMQSAIDAYARLLAHRPDEADVYFNIALLYKNAERYEDAISAYERAVRLGIDRVEEVYSNLGNLYAEMLNADKAREMYEHALAVAPNDVTSLFNLAGLHEESGHKEQAIELYERIQSIDSCHWKSLARLAYPKKVTDEHAGLISRLKACIDELDNDTQAKEVLYFALGKAYDDLESYEKAAQSFVAANEISKRRVLHYSPGQTEQAFDRVIELFNSEWIQERATDSDLSPIFICGMYRSGSTLLERMLAGHPAIVAGGELNTLPNLVARYLGPFPQGVRDATREQLRLIAKEYDRNVRKRVPHSRFVTDKRPDNFLRVGLIRAIFPTAKIIHTRRNIRDNCLSVYFQQFGRATSYANDLRHIAHYYSQQERLFSHWKECFSNAVYVVNYEELIESPERVLRGVLESLGLEWDPGVLDFRSSSGLVRTYSVWQVREGLHSRSKDRWRNYEPLLGRLAEMSLAEIGGAEDTITNAVEAGRPETGEPPP